MRFVVSARHRLSWLLSAFCFCQTGIYSAVCAADDTAAPSAINFKTPIVPRLQGFISTAQAPDQACSYLSLNQMFDVLATLDDCDKATQSRPTGKMHFASNAAVSLANFIFDLRGFDWSKEGANAALDQNLQPKGDQAKEYLHRKEVDNRHLQTVSSILEIAEGLGTADHPAEKEVDAAMQVLSDCIGSSGAADVLATLTRYSGDSTECDTRGKQWDLQTRNNKLKEILECAAEKDPVVTSLKQRLEKYNHRSKAVQISAKVVYSAMGIASFSPTLVAPIAETVLLAFMMATGGPEQDKLLKEVYLTKCLESRVQLLNEEAHLLVDARQSAVGSKNPLLLSCTESLLTQVVGDSKTADRVLRDHGTSMMAARIDEEQKAK